MEGGASGCKVFQLENLVGKLTCCLLKTWLVWVDSEMFNFYEKWHSNLDTFVGGGAKFWLGSPLFFCHDTFQVSKILKRFLLLMFGQFRRVILFTGKGHGKRLAWEGPISSTHLQKLWGSECMIWKEEGSVHTAWYCLTITLEKRKLNGFLMFSGGIDEQHGGCNGLINPGYLV